MALASSCRSRSWRVTRGFLPWGSIENPMDWKIMVKIRWKTEWKLDISWHKTAAERSKSLSTCSKSCMDQSIKTDSENRLCSSGVSVTWLRKGSWQHRGLGIVPSDCSLPKPEILYKQHSNIVHFANPIPLLTLKSCGKRKSCHFNSETKHGCLFFLLKSLVVLWQRMWS